MLCGGGARLCSVFHLVTYNMIAARVVPFACVHCLSAGLCLSHGVMGIKQSEPKCKKCKDSLMADALSMLRSSQSAGMQELHVCMLPSSNRCPKCCQDLVCPRCYLALASREAEDTGVKVRVQLTLTPLRGLSLLPTQL